MTDNRTTELLREGLTEHGIEWRSGLEGVTFVGDWCFVEYDNGKLAATCEPVLTPEQATAATLGSGTLTAEQVREVIERHSLSYGEIGRCFHDASWQAIADELNDKRHVEMCEPPYDMLLRCLKHDWNISASWDGLRKFWNIELTDEGVKLRDATHGTLTAEQVREAIEEAKAELLESCEYVGDMNQRQSDVLKAFGKIEQAIAAWNTRTATTDAEFACAVHDGNLWRRVKGHIRCRNCGLNIESVIALDGCNEHAIKHCPNCGRRVE